MLDDLHLNPLPEWRKLPKHLHDEGEDWKFREALQAAETLYNQWREIYGLVSAFAENLPDEEEEKRSFGPRSLIYESAAIVAPKIMSAAGDTLYQIKMENAALIRHGCRQMMEQIAFAAMMGMGDEAHKNVIRDAMREFKSSFRKWVAIFQEDGLEDEWGLFGPAAE